MHGVDVYLYADNVVVYSLCTLPSAKRLNVASNNVQFYVVTFNLSLEPVLDVLEF